MKKILLLIFIVFNWITIIEGFSLDTYTALFDNSCQITCDNQVHILCRKPNVSKSCRNFEAIKHTKEIELEFKKGSNGLRNRLALNKNISGMRQLWWDKSLQDYATLYVSQCPHNKLDPCSTQTRSRFHRYSMVAMNTAFYRLPYLPKHYIAMTLRDWFKEQSITSYSAKQDNYAEYDRENNFTHMSTYYTFRLGCASARYDDGFGVICLYYRKHPFYKDLWFGKPCSDCHSQVPICSLEFENLCTYYDGITKIMPMNLLYILLILFLIQFLSN